MWMCMWGECLDVEVMLFLGLKNLHVDGDHSKIVLEQRA